LSKGLTKEQAELVQRKNLENLVKKVSAGKVLSAREFELLEASASEVADEKKQVKIRSWSGLAKALGVSRKTVWDLRDHHNGPTEIDLELWQAFLEKRADTNPHWQNEDKQSAEMRDLRFKLLRAQAGKEEATRKLKELEYKRAEAGLVPMTEAMEAIKMVMAPLRALVDALPKACAVQANPTDPQLAEEAIRNGTLKIYEMMEKHKSDASET
tara:strand:+ start:2448 stop:3086 length:639 start_codon:yes stop_codon:yes gene_type:complete